MMADGSAIAITPTAESTNQSVASNARRLRLILGAFATILVSAGVIVLSHAVRQADEAGGLPNNLRSGPPHLSEASAVEIPQAGVEHASKIRPDGKIVTQVGDSDRFDFVLNKEKVIAEDDQPKGQEEVVFFAGQETTLKSGQTIPSSDDMLVIEGPNEKKRGGSEDECVYKNDLFSCYHYTENDRWLIAEVNTNFVTNPETGKLDQHQFEFPHSTHEILKSPYEFSGRVPVVWITQMDSGQLVKITPADDTYLLAEPKFERFGPFKVSGIRDNGDKAHVYNSIIGQTTESDLVELFKVTPFTDKHILFHQALFPQLKNAPHNIMYLTAENINSIVSWDWTQGKDTFEAIYPIPYEDTETGWKCWDWANGGALKDGKPDMDAPGLKRCPTGNRPHTMAEDADGNIWVSLKFGAVARLTNPTHITDPRLASNWRIFNAGGEGLETDVIFYIKGNKAGTHIWANLFKSNQLIFVDNPTAPFPKLKHFDIALPHAVAAKPHSGGDSGLGAFPAGLRVLNNGDCLFTCYRKFGMVGKMSVNGETALTHIPHNDDAFLHLDFNTDADGSDEVIKLWLLASNNAYPNMPGSSGSAHDLFHKAKQPETILQLQDFNTKTMTYSTRIEFRAPTQNSYLHRITAFEHGNLAIATELLTDKVMVILDTEKIKGSPGKEQITEAALKKSFDDTEETPEEQAKAVAQREKEMTEKFSHNASEASQPAGSGSE